MIHWQPRGVVFETGKVTAGAPPPPPPTDGKSWKFNDKDNSAHLVIGCA